MEYEGTPIGNISVVRLSEECEYAELGYCMGYAYWNKGFMSEAAKAVIDYLFAEIGVNRVGISHAVKNPASGRVAQKCGLTKEQSVNTSKLRLGSFLIYLITVSPGANGKT